MFFGQVDLEQAEGGILAHALRSGALMIRKGVHLDAALLERLRSAGVGSVTIARLDPGDIGEDEAAAGIAEHVAGNAIRVSKAGAGRCNLHARAAGVAVVDSGLVDLLNAIDEGVTIATRAPYAPVVADEMVATIKIIPYGLPAPIVARAIQLTHHPLITLAPFLPYRIGVILTETPEWNVSLSDKALAMLERRIAHTRSRIARAMRVPHTSDALAAALRDIPDVDLIVIFNASATSDRRDVTPVAVEAAGGIVRHLGMPADPGNLLVLATLDGRPVIGAPGCARSPKYNGFDIVLDRLLAGIPVGPQDIRRMGVGGLLQDIPGRPSPRAPKARYQPKAPPAMRVPHASPISE